jgi:hypothetical protein
MSCRIPKQSIKKFFNCERGKAEEMSRRREAEVSQKRGRGEAEVNNRIATGEAHRCLYESEARGQRREARGDSQAKLG